MTNFEQLFAAYDYLNEVVYVSDIDTYELVYCNQKAKQVFHMEKETIEPGRKCYEYIQNLDQPCVFCNNDKLKQEHRCLWTRQYQETGQDYFLYDSLITVDGKQYRMDVAVEANFLDDSRLHSYQMADMENYLTNCVRQIVKAEDFSNSVSAVLQTVLNYYGGERAYLFEIDWENKVSNNTYEICIPGVTAEIDNLQNVPLEYMRFWLDQFRKKAVLVIEDLNAIKDDAERQDEYETLAAQDINSIIAVPFYFGQQIAGFIGVDNPKLNFENTDYLINLAYFIGVEIEKQHVVHDLQDQSCKDPLTGVYNRKGFDEMIRTMPSLNHPSAFGIIDIDNFKLINDSYGHTTGDVILKEVAEMLVNVFRDDDKVFRLGGDEFAVLLNNCGAIAWNTICSKLQWIHSSMVERHKDITITLSMGICFSSNKLSEKIYALADDALYHTKRNGRAGCTMIDETSGEKKTWYDDLSFHMKNILEYNDTGLFRVEFPKDEKPFMVCSDIVREIFGFPKDMNLNECYQLWLDGIDESYLSALIQMRKQLMEGGQAECTYLWKHPVYGKIYIRTIGIGEMVNGTRVIHGYHHSLRETQIIERQDDNKILFSAINRIYDGSYYINIENGSYEILKSARYEQHLKLGEKDVREDLIIFIGTLVHPEYQHRMMEFCDISTVSERMKNQNHLDCEYLCAVDHRWYRATYIPVKYNDEGEVTHILFEILLLDEFSAQESEKNNQNARSLHKREISLEAALNAANQLCYEYDPVAHTGECYTDENYFGLPKYIEQYPDSLKELDLFHPDDVDIFIQTAHQMDDGTEKAQCDVRIKKNGKYCWYACLFDAYFDPQKGRNVAILNVVDITIRIEAINQYEERIKAFMTVKEEALSMCMINVTQNTYEMVSYEESVEHFIDSDATFEMVMMSVADNIIGESSQQAYRRTFCRENLLRQAASGNMHVQLEYLLRLNEAHYEWVVAIVEMTKNPITGDIGGVAYSRSIQKKYMTDFLLERALEQDYLFAATIFVDTDEFYLYNSDAGVYSACMQDYWTVALNDPKMHCSEEVLAQLKEFFVKDKILAQLNTKGEISFSFDSVYKGQMNRLEIKFSYLDESLSMLLASMRNITDSTLLEKFRYDSEHDPLTDLYNRKKFIREAEKMLQKYPYTEFAIIHYDIKNFHRYNTFFGEEAGDQLLCDMADLIRKSCADYEYAIYGRIEADIFCSLIPNDKKVMDMHIHSLLPEVRKYRDDFLLEPKIGIYMIGDREIKVEAMFTRAAMAAANKLRTTNQTVSVYDNSLEEKMLEEQQVVNDMNTAIEQEQFRVYLQGKYELRTNELIGAEALVRWEHPEKGIISPAKFIPIFEGNGFIMTLDRYMWEHTCQLLCKWRAEGRELLPISVNVSRISIFNPTTVSFLKELVTRYEIEPKYLELELTESAYVENQEIIKPRLLELQKYGFKILMDDFGSGYSSLNTLKDLPVDVLKLDMKFMAASDNAVRGDIVLSSIIRMAKLLHLSVIAEGVEKQDQAEYLRGMGCEYVQGYLYAKPVSVAEFETQIFVPNAVSQTDMYAAKEEEEQMSFTLTTANGPISEHFPSPMMVLEYNQYKNTFQCLRVNVAFMNEFRFIKDLRPLDEILQEQLTAADYDRMLRAFAKCSETKKSIYFRMEWIDENKVTHKFLINTAHEGNIGDNAVLVAVFADEATQNLIE